ncbi:MAG TPA: hypothetical protein VMF50_01605 [Candidatus Binataceae bacterium]|nr:hypothetical protein [Candidatus Binataceae bacterium]
MKTRSKGSSLLAILNRWIFVTLALVMGLSAGGCFYSHTVESEPPKVVQVPAPPPVVVQSVPTVPTVEPEHHQVTTTWGPNGTVQKQTTTIASPDGPVQKQTTTTWNPNGAMESESNTTSSSY